MTSTRKQKEKDAARMKLFRANASAEQKKIWSQQAMERRKRRQKKQKIQVKNRRQYLRRCQNNATNIPSTPNSKIQLITSIIESATPTTAEKLSEVKLFKLRDRDAQHDIVKATGEAVKANPPVRRSLLPRLQTANKKAVSEVLGVSRTHFYFKSKRGSKPKTSNETREKVIQFYTRADISTQYPNKYKNFLVLRQSQKRTHALFLAEYPQHKMSKTTFYKLRPKQVKLMKASKWLQCLCDVCDSVQLIVKSIRASLIRSCTAVPDEFQHGNEMELAAATVCDIRNDDCLKRKCQSCSPMTALEILVGGWLDSEETLSYYVWDYVKEKVKDKEITKMKKVLRCEDRVSALSSLSKRLMNFPLHLTNAVRQLSAYKHCKDGLKENEVVCVIDFAENFTCRQYAEAQSAYYSRNAATVHPMVLIFPSNSRVKRDSFVCVSGDLSHDAAAVKAFIQALSSHVESKYPHIEHIHIWSDGCGAQYKSKVPMYNLARNFEVPLQLTWNYYGSRHGKSESDGESGVVKTFLDNQIKAKQLTVNDADDIYELLTTSILLHENGESRRHFRLIAKERIESIRQETPLTNEIRPIKGVRQLHQIKQVGPGIVMYRRLSCYHQNGCDHDKDWTEFNIPG